MRFHSYLCGVLVTGQRVDIAAIPLLLYRNELLSQDIVILV